MIKTKKIIDLIYKIICKYQFIPQICRITILEIPENNQNIIIIGESHSGPVEYSNTQYEMMRNFLKEIGYSVYSMVQELLIQFIRLLATYQKINVLTEIRIPVFNRGDYKNISYQNTDTVRAMNFFEENKIKNVDLHTWDIRGHIEMNFVNIYASKLSEENFRGEFSGLMAFDQRLMKFRKLAFVESINDFFGMNDDSSNLSLLIKIFNSKSPGRIMKKYITGAFKNIFIKHNSDYLNDITDRYDRTYDYNKIFFKNFAFNYLMMDFLKTAIQTYNDDFFWKHPSGFFNNTYRIVGLTFVPISDMYNYLILFGPMVKGKTSIFLAGDFHSQNMLHLYKAQYNKVPQTLFKGSDKDGLCILKNSLKKTCKAQNPQGYKPCKKGQVYNIETNKCINLNAKTYTERLKKKLINRKHPCETKQCAPGKVCNPLSGRCKKKKISCENITCPINKTCNPRTLRCIKIDGPVYNKVFEQVISKKRKRKKKQNL
ncbi:hypothetical protein [Heterosigma akashiwo virus 01]|uniref:Uncharacterized protein n=1 Tax=Heterosigma akashiwo virus 01 TaxID=97195 RepID=A0A1C9C543_HAV01|nr:hypothetical protein D1R72_gp080 [Heterosigma akashiwo virus 01]AOM63411.1 hypothetical protein [Heterosigma akashiwo virus 01]